MRTSHAVMVGLVAASMFVAAAPADAQPITITQRTFGPARQTLDAAITAHGGLQALRAIKDIDRTGTATVHNQGQSPRPGTPYTTRPVTIKSVVDFEKGRSFTEQVFAFAGGIRAPTRVVLRGDDGFTLAVITNVMTPLTPGGIAGAKAAIRRDPVTLLLTAAARAETLRDLGDATFDRRKQRVVTFADSDGTQIALYFDAQTRRLTKLETLGDHPVLGDTVTEQVLSDYRAINGVQLPHRVITRVGGEQTQDLQYSEIKVNTSPAGSLFAPPAGSFAAKPIGGPTSVVATKLGDGVYFIEGGSHNSLAVVGSDGVVLIEAPLNDERSQAVIAKLAEIAPGKPIKTVVMTHYHYDHSGGLRAYIAAGATIVTTANNRDFVTKVAAAPHTIRPDAQSRAKAAAKIEVITGKKQLGEGALAVELHDVGPTPHVDEALVAYLPRHKVVFVSDLFSIPAEGPLPPGSPATHDFAGKIKKLGLDVQTIAPGHGRLGTIKDLQKALDTPPPTVPEARSQP